MTAAKERTATLPSAGTLPETRVWRSDFGKQAFIGASCWLSSTLRQGCEYRCDGTASVPLDQRYYASSYGRFNTADPYQASAGPSDPVSWNRYAYVGGDPVNRVDSRGLCWGLPQPQRRYATEDQGFDDCDESGDGGDWGCGAGWMTDASLSGPCAGLGVIATPPAKPAAPSCSISVDERPVPDSRFTPGAHAYLTVTDSDWNTPLLLEGGPTGNGFFSSLYGYDTQAPGQGLGAGTVNASDPSLPSNKQLGATYSGPLAGGAVGYLLSRIDSYDSGKLATYNFLGAPGTYNSNSFAYTLLNDLNSVAFGSILRAFGQSAPGWVAGQGGWLPGWGKLVPGL